MKDPRSASLKELATRAEVFASSLEDLQEGDQKAKDSLRRIARSIAMSAGKLGLEDVGESAREVAETTTKRELVSRGRKLLRLLEGDTEAEEDQASEVSLLIVDDDPTSALLLRNMLKASGREIHVAGDGAEGERMLKAHEIDLILLDLFLPDTDGRDLLVRIRENPATATIPVVIYSGQSAAETKAECLALGADEYLEKPVEPEVARSVVARQLRRKAEREHDSLVDPITGAASRAGLSQAFGAARGAFAASGHRFALASLEIDRFQGLSVALGEEASNRLVRDFASVVKSVLRPEDLLAHCSGGHFTTLFRQSTPGEVKRMLASALEIVERDGIVGSGGERMTMSFSAGVVDASGQVVLRETMAQADRLLYLARSVGTGQIVAEGQDLELPSQRILLVEDDGVTATLIKHRLGKDGFDVVHHDDGRDAHDTAQGETFALAIFDVKLPGMDGFELLERVRELAHFDGVPIIMLTSMGRENDIVRGFDLGANDYILKPFSPVELVARIHRLLDN